MKVKVLGNLSYQTYPITKDMIEISQADLKEIGKTLQFGEGGELIPYTPPVETKSYDELVNEKIRERYNLSQELAILRQRDSKPNEFNEYNEYCEKCKSEVKVLCQ